MATDNRSLTRKILGEKNVSKHSNKTLSGRLRNKYGTQADIDAAIKKNESDWYGGNKAGVSGVERRLRLEGLHAQKKEQAKMHDMAQGAEFGEELLGKEGLGRLGTDTNIKDVLNRMNSISKTGMSDKESLMQREAMFDRINNQSATAEHQLLARLGGRGVRGAVAGNQLAGIQMEGMRQRAEAERDVYLKDEHIKRSGLQDYASAVGQVKTFDIGQAAREKDIVLSSAMGFAGIGSADRGAAAQAQAAAQAAAAQAAAACFAGHTKVKMQDGTYKEIKNVDLGEVTANGIIYGTSKHLVLPHFMVNYEGIIVTKCHPVYEDGVWMYAGDSKKAKPLGEEYDTFNIYVYDLWTDTQRLTIKSEEGNDVLFTDYEGQDVSQVNDELIDMLNEEETNDNNVVALSS